MKKKKTLKHNVKKKKKKEKVRFFSSSNSSHQKDGKSYLWNQKWKWKWKYKLITNSEHLKHYTWSRLLQTNNHLLQCLSGESGAFKQLWPVYYTAQITEGPSRADAQLITTSLIAQRSWLWLQAECTGSTAEQHS